MTPLLYLLVFLSGAAALIYEVAWVRSLSLVFGGSHLAVTVVLSVYMGGIALGGWLLGRRAESATRPLRLYGLLELGIGLSALAVLGLLVAYPFLYGPLARLAETNRIWLTLLRTLFSSAALLVPTTLMGGTLPALARAAPRRLAAIYGVNTLGAVAGALASSFLLLPAIGVRATILVAVAANASVGISAIALGGRASTPAPPASRAEDRFALTPVLLGIGISGFCALGYEVLWTRMLTLVLGTSVYAFTIMLAAFLCGIGLGSNAEALFARAPRRSFGLVQIAIGLSALGVTILMRDLPTHALRIQSAIAGSGSTEFAARQGASFAVAFATMSVPAFFMGVAFPLAAEGAPVRRVLTVNTIGAIAGAAASGFVLIPAFGIERALQMLVAINVGIGAVVLTRRRTALAAGVATAAVVVTLAAAPGWGRAWNSKYFAIFRNTQRNAFDSPERIDDALENTDVVFYAEGANEIISVIRPRGGWQAFLVNGRPEATTSPMDMQCQRALGHLPMLLHPNPRRIFVLGTGTGMTLGATSIHPEVQSIVLAEIEPKALEAARTFAAWNHHVLDDPKLRIILNDGRNYLATTAEMFDVVTADPIHPWSGGAAYLYTAEYFRTVARHLNPGGIACQWLPIYELTPEDLAMVVRTFALSFPHTMIWLTHYDAEIVGSNAPIVLDREALARRLANPAIAADLAEVEMGGVEDLLSYFIAGDRGTRAFAAAGRVNTDDNLALEFAAPRSMGVADVMGNNVRALAAVRESVGVALPVAGASRLDEAAKLYDPAHALFLWGESDGAPFRELHAKLAASFPEYAPFRFLEKEERARLAATPRAIDEATFRVRTSTGDTRTLTVSAVTMRIGDRRAAVMFVDNETRTIFGQRYFDGSPEALDHDVAGFAGTTLGELRASYARLGEVPAEAAVVDAFKSRLR